jgi:hypothetical protein
LIAPARPAVVAVIRLYESATCAASIAARSEGDHRLLRIDQRLVGVDRALRDEVLREQVLAPRQLPLRVGERGEVLGELRARLGDVDLVVARVEGEEELAGGDELAFLDVHLGDRARHLRPDVDAVERGDGAGGVEHDRDVALLHRRQRDADRGAAGAGARPGERGRRRAERRVARAPAALQRVAGDRGGDDDDAGDAEDERFLHSLEL